MSYRTDMVSGGGILFKEKYCYYEIKKIQRRLNSYLCIFYDL